MAGNQGNNRITWAEWQLDFLIENWQIMTAQQLSDAIGITRTKVREKKYELGLYVIELEYWAPEQVIFLKENYQSIGDTELAQLFSERWTKYKGWSKKHIEKKRRQLGLKRAPLEILAIHQRNVAAGAYALCPVKAWASRGGAAQAGTLRIWTNNQGSQFMVIKIKDRYVHYARWLYEQLRGTVPDGCVVRLKDGNPLHVTPGNLQLITRSQHAIINSQNRHPQLTTSRKLIHQINLIAKRNEKQTNRPQQSPLRPAGAAQ